MTTGHKVRELDPLREELLRARGDGQSIALANGLFDLLHVGHLRYLEAAAEQADLLVVAVNSDESARRLKGPDRPLIPESERAELLAGFACVDFVIVFGEPSVEHLLRELRPDVHCKGTDYSAGNVPEAGVAQELGIRVAIVGDPKCHATREIIARLSKRG